MSTSLDQTEYEIKPGSRFALPDVSELWASRDLIFVLVRRDYLAKYAQTVLGPIWFLIQPLITSLVFSVIFGGIAKMDTGGVPHLLFYFSALLPWGYFSHTLTSTSTTLIGNQSLFSKVYFPRLAPAIAASVSNLLGFTIQFVLFLCFWMYFKFFTGAGEQFHLRPAALLLAPLFLLQAGLLGMGCGLWLSVMTAKYRDLQHATGFMVQLWMYSTPIIYSLQQGLEKLPPVLQPVIWLNPVSSITAGYRDAFLGTTSVTPEMMLCSWGLTLVILLGGSMMFRKVETDFIDTI